MAQPTIWFALDMMLLLWAAEAQNLHPSEVCLATDPNREHQFVGDQDQLLAAVMNPNVACILVNQTIKLTQEGWGLESLLFKDKGCIRYGWPFCAHQVLTHEVAIAPAPGLLATQAELHYPTGTLYSTYLEFLGTGRCTMIGMRAFGLLDLEDLGLARGLELLDGGGGSDPDSPQLEVALDIPIDARHVLGGNAGLNDTKVFIHCGPRYQLVLQLFSLGLAQYSTSNLEKGEVYVTASFPEVLGVSKYIIDPANPSTRLVALRNMSIDLRMTNATFACCENLACFGDGCVDDTCNPTLVNNNTGSLQYEGHEYTLLPRSRSASEAEAECASSLGTQLASFVSLGELYDVTKALFISEDGILLRTLRLTVWVSKEQSRDLDLHWKSPAGLANHNHSGGVQRLGQDSAVPGVSDCVAVDVITQLLLYQDCNKAASFICQRELPEPLAWSPPPPRRYLSPPEASSGEAFPQVALVAVVVVAGLVAACALTVCYPACSKARRARAAKARRSSVPLDGFMQTNSVYLNHPPSINAREAELDVEGEVVRMPANQLRTEFEKLLMETTKNAQVYDGSGGSGVHTARHDSSSQMLYSNSKNPAPPKQFPVFDGYEVIRELGKGTHATCYLTKDKNMELWAIKVPTSDHTTVKVVQEAYFLQLIDHANVVAHKRTIVRQGKIVLVTEFCDKGDLHSLLKQADRPFSERFICHALLQCAMGLSRMHACNIAHRDVKPANILLKSGALFKLADLGASCMILDTEHTSFTGTPLFMAPEVLAGEAQAVQTDIYSLGCVGYMMCMLKTPYQSNTVHGLRKSIKHDVYEDIPSDLFSADLIELIRGMLLPQPAERPTAEDICNLDWLFQYCCRDFETFSKEGGGFHAEILGRNLTTHDSAHQCEREQRS